MSCSEWERPAFRVFLQPDSSIPTNQTLEQIAARLEEALKNLAFREQDNQVPLNVTTVTNSFYGHPNQYPTLISQSTVRGNQTATRDSSYISNVNSGNTLVTVIENSNNRR